MGPWESVRGGRDGPRSGRAAAVTRPAVVHSSVIARRQPATAMRGVAFGFVWFRTRAWVHSAVTSRSGRFGFALQTPAAAIVATPRAPNIEFASARAERPSAAHDHLRSGANQTRQLTR
jgi:hypothetical protein